MKKSIKLFGIRDMVLFFISLFLSVALLSFGFFYLLLGENRSESELAGAEPETETQSKTILFCDIDNNVSYEFELDVEQELYDVKRLYIDNSIYDSQGLSGLKAFAESEYKQQFNFIIAVTETQHAAIMDYVGGVARDIDERLSVICGGISTGYHNLSGIAAMNIYEKESENAELCLSITEEIFIKWCKGISDEAVFFKFLNLSDNNISYTDYVKLRDKLFGMFN